MPVTVEICVEGADGLVAAQEAGADRVELCASLLEGGITPSIGMVRAALAVAQIPFHVIIRPRGGDFLYSEIEFRSMLEDVKAMKALGVAGVVIGCLTPEGTIDEARTKALVDAAKPMKVTNHRAFDMTRDVDEAIEALVRCGVDRVLTSGQADTAEEGVPAMARAVAAAKGRIRIMACGGLNAGNIADVYRQTHVDDVHFAALKTVDGGMHYRNMGVTMGGEEADEEFTVTITDGAAVKETIAALRTAL
ncbi:MAG TPA: copper homeostasis protein CutC [Devosia sp.]|nr:copper homeostasis protein CutC [Devosia sp.]